VSGYKYLISIIIPVYNAADRLPRALDSIIKQTIGFERLEVILVDDASTDGSAELIDGFAARYGNVVALHTGANSGYAGRPRNRGLERASAEHVMFLDQDDSYYPDACALLHEEAAGGADIAGGYYSEHDRSGAVIRRITGTYRGLGAFGVAGVDERPDILELHSGFWAKIYRRQLIEERQIRFVEDAPVEDMVFYAEAVLGMSGYRYIERPIVRYALRDAGADRSLSFAATEEGMRAVGRGYDALYRVFARYGRERYLTYIMRRKAEYYTGILLKGEYGGVDAADDVSAAGADTGAAGAERAAEGAASAAAVAAARACIEGLSGVYEGVAAYSDEKLPYASRTMTELVSAKRYDEAARFLLAAQPFSRRIDSLKVKNRALKEENRALRGRLRRAERSYAELQRRLKHSIIIRIFNKIRRWRLF
jgi:glycosyltransferase involved in cell wall biosynthesis